MKTKRGTSRAGALATGTGDKKIAQLAEQLDPWIPGGLFTLGTDGFGRSDTRGPLRRHFEVDAECIAIGTLSRLAAEGAIGAHVVADAIRRLGVNPDKIDAASA